MYNIFPTGSSVEVFGGHGRLSPFHWWNHWPVSQITSDGRGARAADRLAHSSLLWGAPNDDFLLYGISDIKPTELFSLAKSWNHSPKLKDLKGFQSFKYIQEERAYHIQADASEISFIINASPDSPLVNPAFVVKNWKSDSISLEINGEEIKPGEQFRFGTNYDTAGNKYMILWLEMDRQDSVKLEFRTRN